MINIIQNSLRKTSGVISAIFTLAPEAFFEKYNWITEDMFQQNRLSAYIDVQAVNIIISRLAFFLFVWFVMLISYWFFLKFRKQITIKGPNYLISIEYGNIQKKKNCKKVINFDECFTTKVGNAIGDINPDSICGQYLKEHPNLDAQQLIKASHVKPARSKSKYQHKIRYDSGTIIPNGDDLLMAFAKLDERGKGRFFSRDEYLQCLDLLWKEIENYYSEKDVCVPILGAGTTSIDGGAGASISQQDLLNMMIWSYKLSSHKIKAPHKLRIICRKNSDFSINNIDG